METLQKDEMESFREKLFGKSVVKVSDVELDHWRFLNKYGFRESEWEKLHIRDRAKFKAMHLLDTMQSVIERFDEINEENKKKREQQATDRNKKKS